MTLRTFREAYIAARFLEGHRLECGHCQYSRIPCTDAADAMAICGQADSLLDIADTRQARRAAWRDRSPSRK